MADAKKTLEMRVAELEDKLSQMSLTEEEARGVQKFLSASSAGQAQIPAPSNCVINQCIRPCVIQPCIIHQCIQPCVIRQCIINQCFECSCGPCIAGSGGGTGTGGFGGLG